MAGVRFFFGAFLSLFLVGVIVALPGAALPHWREAFGVGREVSSFFAALLLGLFLGIRLAQGERRHPLLPGALLLLALAFLGVALAPAFVWVVALAFPVGLAQGVLNVHGNSLVGELFPERRVESVNRVNVGFGLGAVFTPLALTLLPYAALLLLAGLLALLAALLVWEAPPVKSLARGGAQGLLPFLLAVALYTGLEGALATWNRVWLEGLGYATATGGILLSLYWLFLALGRLLLAGLVAQRPLLVLKGLLLGVTLLLLLNLFPPPPSSSPWRASSWAPSSPRSSPWSRPGTATGLWGTSSTPGREGAPSCPPSSPFCPFQAFPSGSWASPWGYSSW